MDKPDWKNVRIVKHTAEILGSKESLYTKQPGSISAESRDLLYLHLVSQSQSRKTVVGLFGYGSAGKTTLVKAFGKECSIRGASVHIHTETLYEKEREATLHVHPMVAFLSGKHTPSHVLTLIDTSGHADMLSQTIQTIECVDIAIVLIDITGHLSLCHRIILDAIRTSKKPSFVILNKFDVIVNDVSLVEKMTNDFINSICSVLEPTAFLIASFKSGWIRLVDKSFNSIFNQIPDRVEKHVQNDLIDILVDIISKSASNSIKQTDLMSILGFILLDNVVLCSIVPNEDTCVGSLITVNDKEMRIESIYIPVCGCLIETDRIASGIGVLVRFDQDEVLNMNTEYVKPEYLIKSITRLLETELYGLSFLDVLKPLRMAECVDGVIRVKLSVDDQGEFESGVKKLKLVYCGLVHHANVLGGPGEAFMDAVLHDLRVMLEIKFEVVAVFCALKEVVVNEFEMNAGERDTTAQAKIYMNEESEINLYTGNQIFVNIESVNGKFTNSSIERLHNNCNEKDYLSAQHLSEKLLNGMLDTVQNGIKVLEPTYLMEIVYMEDANELVCEMICMSKAQVIHESILLHNGMKIKMCLVPVSECFGFESDLRCYSCCLANCTMIPFCWNVLNDTARLDTYIKCMDTINSMHK
ncbi:elongation factor G [Ordospora colligata]|uniref:Tr-type G domain-containing protein n=1 Tax=Ordospora colligata OC4 TaxID=1354746 RepID=A0A0B2UJ10_9MICR|nr:uncharacterized protein M896_100260 [Ordospora colligata OC4]KHN69042.1 hypothetical protein M896_100260 [Ordospora colligata OC4]TBU14323.1 hypothetical protein CWI40_100270 [Ordospora colligata]TBU14388.1 hypothetical protein CWI41_100270 [Ordospora colligata]